MACCSWVFFWLCITLTLRAEVQATSNNGTPSRILSKILIMSPDWLGKVPPSSRLNAPEFLESLYPGQRIALALAAVGPERESLFSRVKLGVKFSAGTHGTVEERDLYPVAIRQIKAQGADVAMLVLKAGGISRTDQARLESATSLVTFAFFQPAWKAPLVDQAESAQIVATISGSQPGSILEPVVIKVRPTSDWLGDPRVSIQEFGQYMNRYHQNIPPGRLLLLLESAKDDGDLGVPSILGFFAVAFRDQDAARSSAIAFFPSLDPKTQLALATVFRFGGQDIHEFLPVLLPKLPANIAAYLEGIKPLKDPRESLVIQDPVSMDAVRGIGATMDECWGGWMAKGDRSYLRALVGLLEGAPDYPEYLAWRKARTGAQGMNARVARGLAYQIAGWSIGAFQRADPLVSDWILYWENDPNFPQMLRRELANLPGNPAFRRN